MTPENWLLLVIVSVTSAVWAGIFVIAYSILMTAMRHRVRQIIYEHDKSIDEAINRLESRGLLNAMLKQRALDRAKKEEDQ